MELMNKKEIKRGDVCLVKMGYLYGSKTEEYRPVIVVQNDLGNKHSSNVIVCPVKSKLKSLHLPTHVLLSKGAGNLVMDSIMLAETLITFPKSELVRYIGSLPEEDMVRVNKAISISLGLEG